MAITPLSLNDPHALGEDIIYTIMRALAQQMGATMCVAVLALPPDTPTSPRAIQHEQTNSLSCLLSFLHFCFGLTSSLHTVDAHTLVTPSIIAIITHSAGALE